jgi:hypothetical protein
VGANDDGPDRPRSPRAPTPRAATLFGIGPQAGPGAISGRVATPVALEETATPVALEETATPVALEETATPVALEETATPVALHETGAPELPPGDLDAQRNPGDAEPHAGTFAPSSPLAAALRDLAERPTEPVQGLASTPALPDREGVEAAPSAAPRPRRSAIVVSIAISASVLLIGLVVLVIRAARSPATGEPSASAPASAPLGSASSGGPEVAAGASASARAEAPRPSPATAGKGTGWLTVRGPAGQVLIKGKAWGASGTKLAVPCGAHMMTIGVVDAKGRPVRTITKPQTISVPCGGSVTIDARR